MIHLYRSIQRDVFADYLDHAAERVVEELDQQGGRRL